MDNPRKRLRWVIIVVFLLNIVTTLSEYSIWAESHQAGFRPLITAALMWLALGFLVLGYRKLK